MKTKMILNNPLKTVNAPPCADHAASLIVDVSEEDAKKPMIEGLTEEKEMKKKKTFVHLVTHQLEFVIMEL